MKRDNHKPTGPSQRQLRVGELVRHALANVFSRGDVEDEVLEEDLLQDGMSVATEVAVEHASIARPVDREIAVEDDAVATEPVEVSLPPAALPARSLSASMSKMSSTSERPSQDHA